MTDFALEIVKVLLGGLLAAGITLFVSGRRQDRDRTRAARYLAIKLIGVFEKYATACGDAVSQNHDDRRTNPFDYSGLARLPDLSELPDDPDGWRALEPAYSIQAQTFDQQIVSARSIISNAAEWGDADEVEKETNRHASELGLRAIDLAAAIRGQYLLPPATEPITSAAEYLRREKSVIERDEEAERLDAAQGWERDQITGGGEANPED